MSFIILVVLLCAGTISSSQIFGLSSLRETFLLNAYKPALRNDYCLSIVREKDKLIKALQMEREVLLEWMEEAFKEPINKMETVTESISGESEKKDTKMESIKYKVVDDKLKEPIDDENIDIAFVELGETQKENNKIDPVEQELAQSGSTEDSDISTETPEIDKSGWIVIQSRIDDTVDFQRSWEYYKRGFGNPNGNYFIGLENLHLLTKAKRCELFIELRDVNGTTGYARYDNFAVGSEDEDYMLKSLGAYSGTAGDSLSAHLNLKFSTIDRDNDIWKFSCANLYNGGWWFSNCGHSSLNGIFNSAGGKKGETGILWGSWKRSWDWNISLIYSKMMIRPMS